MELKKFIKTSIREYLNEQILLHNIILEATADEIKVRYYPNIPQDDFNKIINSDKVTSNLENGKVGKYAKWLLKLYSNDNLNLDDLNKIEKYLPIFDKLSKSDKTTNKDINTYNSLDDVYNVINSYLDSNKTISKGDEIRKTKEKAKKIDINDNRFIVIQPLTKQASCYYGKGSQWCTSSNTSDNKFDEYISLGPLYIIMDKSKRNDVGDYAKYKIHFQKGEFKDDNNQEVNFKKNPEIKEAIKKLIKVIKINPMDLVNYKSMNIMFIDNPSEEVQLNAVTTTPFTIKYIQNPSEQVQLAAVKQNGLTIADIDNPSEEVQQAAIKQNPNSIKFINITNDKKKKEELKHLEDMLKNGYITQNEFNKMKEEI
jgi:hypothetical protein